MVIMFSVSFSSFVFLDNSAMEKLISIVISSTQIANVPDFLIFQIFSSFFFRNC